VRDSIDSINHTLEDRYTHTNTVTSTLRNFLSEILRLYVQIVRPAPQPSTQLRSTSNFDEFINAQQNAIYETQRRVDEAMEVMTDHPVQSHDDSDDDSGDDSVTVNDETSEHERLLRLLEART
jgi:hypothetical protein